MNTTTTAAAPTKTARYIARCKACGVHTSALAAVDSRYLHEVRSIESDGRAQGAAAYLWLGNVIVNCRGCGAPKYARRVLGKVSLKHQCGAKCLSATGTSCECSCGGKNHGAGHAA